MINRVQVSIHALPGVLHHHVERFVHRADLGTDDGFEVGSASDRIGGGAPAVEGVERTLVEQSTREKTLVDATGTLSAAFEFTEKTVDDVEIPLTQLVALPPAVTPRQVRAVVEASGYSRYVIASADGAPTSYLHVKDVLDLVAPQDLDAPVPGDRIRQLATVPGDAELEDALAQQKLRREQAVASGNYRVI